MEKPYNWKREQERLWEALVPQTGRANTLQGELTRIAGKLTDEAYRNGNDNWDDECAQMWRFVGQHVADPDTFRPEQLAEIREAVATIIRDYDPPQGSGAGSPDYMSPERGVDWCIAHPDPRPVPDNQTLQRTGAGGI